MWIWPDNTLGSEHHLVIGLLELFKNLLRSSSKDEVITEGKRQINAVILLTLAMNSSYDQQLVIFSPLRSSKTVVQTIFANLPLVYLISCVCFHWTAGMEWGAFHWRLGFALQTLLICLEMGVTINVIIGNELLGKNQGFIWRTPVHTNRFPFPYTTQHSFLEYVTHPQCGKTVSTVPVNEILLRKILYFRRNFSSMGVT